MTTREKTLAGGLLAVVGGGGLLFVAYLMVLSPWVEKSQQAKKLEVEIAKRDNDIFDIEMQLKKHEANRQRSLPSDIKFSRGKYADLLTSMVRRADFPQGYKISVSDPSSKAAPTLAPKKPAYTMLAYEISGKADLYHLMDFMHNFYAQPLLHSIKKLNIVRPTDARSRERRELDVTITIEALVLDNAQDRPTLLPVESRLAIVGGGSGYTGLNLAATQATLHTSFAPSGVLAEPARSYLAAANKNVFFGPLPTTEKKKDDVVRPDTPAQEDSTPFIVLTSIVGYSDGKIVASLRDKLTNIDYTVTQALTGKISVYSTLNQRDPATGERLDNYYGKQDIICGSESGKNRHAWRVRRVNLLDVIIEQLDDQEPDKDTLPKPKPESVVGGGVFQLLGVSEGKMSKLRLGQTLAGPEPLLSREAIRAIYAPIELPSNSEVSTQDKGR